MFSIDGSRLDSRLESSVSLFLMKDALQVRLCGLIISLFDVFDIFRFPSSFMNIVSMILF